MARAAGGWASRSPRRVEDAANFLRRSAGRDALREDADGVGVLEFLNYWLYQERNEELFLRFDGGGVRAIFTPGYKPVDHPEVLAQLAVLGYGNDTPVQYRLDSEFFLFNIPYKSMAFAVQEGDMLMPGFSIANSEVGLSSLSVSAFILRLLCTNGFITKMRVSSSFRHVSATVLERLQELLQHAPMELARQQNQIRLSLDSQVTNVAATLESFNRQFQLRQIEQEAVIRAWPYEAWPNEEGGNMFHVVNAYSRAAQYANLTAESSYRLQRVAGAILEMVK